MVIIINSTIYKGWTCRSNKKFGEISSNPFNIIWCEYSLKTIIIALCIYILGIGMYESTRKIIVEEKNMVQQNGVLLVQ